MILSRVRTRTGYESISAYTAAEVSLPSMKFRKVYRNRHIYLYAQDFSVFDSETSHDDENGWIYQWAVKLQDVYIYGRRPSEFIELLRRMAKEYNLDGYTKMIIYIHNAAYDVQYLKWYLYQYDPKMRVLATDKHAILICDVFGFRILCSYRLTNLSLDSLSHDYAKTYLKASGAIDYTKRRYQDDILSETDWMYMFSDVASQADGIQGYLDAQGYKYAYDAPFTSTGFVRAKCRHASEKERGWHEKFLASALEYKQYSLCRTGFMGGLVIASYMYSGETVRGPHSIGHVDFISSYPARQMLDYMPVGRGSWWGEIEDMEELEHVLNTYACIFLLTMDDVHIKPGVTAPCIPSSKCVYSEGILKVNGKVVYADTLSIVVTELDYKWIRKQYTAGNVKVSDLLFFERGPAPDWLKGEVMEYFTNKCTLKHSDPVKYNASKALLNAIYGMSATAPVREEYKFNDECMIEKKKSDPEKALKKFYNSYNSFMPYQYGLYVTAHARDALLTLIEMIGYDKFLYCDTDSVFYIKDDAAEAAIEKYNEGVRERAMAAGAYVGEKILGLAEHEPDITAFRALHAKCYAAVQEGKLKVTIAGISKDATKWINGKPVTMTNAEELKKIDNLEDGFVFRHNGGTRCIYVEQEPTIMTIDGHETELASAAIIENIDKEISDTMYTVGKDYEILNLKQEQYIGG